MSAVPDRPVPPVSRLLAELGVPHRVFTHPGVIHSLEQAAAERGQQPDQVVRSILFRLGTSEYLMVLMPGPRQVSWKALRRHLALSRLTMADPDEVLAVTGYPIGAVAPLGLPPGMRILVDQRLLDQAEISLGSGVISTAIILRSADLLSALPGAELADLSA